jgi:broad specificity phosphatase PhoE
MPEMAGRAIESIRGHNAAFGDDATWVAVSHGDVIKAILADALGMHLDAFQRIQVDPGSLSVIRYTELRPFVLRMNDKGSPVTDLIPPKKRGRRAKASSDAVVGGGAGA